MDIVRAARRNGYLASTADAIAVFETSILLAGMRDRAKPTPYDFQDAAVTCIEKDAVPGRRDVGRLVEIMMGGDRIGRVGYDALPPLARDVHDRLAALGLKLDQRGVHRALLNIAAQPELAACSDVLWMLRYLMPRGAARPIMGERSLGEQPIQESWDLALGTHQRALIELGYEGVSIEQVLEQRLRRAAYGAQATTATVSGSRRGRDPVPAQPPPRRRTGDPCPGSALGGAERRRRAGGAAPGAPPAGVLPHQRAGRCLRGLSPS